MYNKGWFALIASVTTFWFINAAASPGDLDAQFGNGGKVITDFFDRTDVGNNLLIDKAGRIILAGSATKTSISDHFALVRYHDNGALDTSFGDEGRVITNAIGENRYVYGGIMGFGFLSDGKIIATGRGSAQGLEGFALLAYNEDGSLDKTFLEDGATIFADNDGNEIHPLALTIDDHDNIIVIASSFHTSGESASFAIFRFSHDGQADKSFGTDGKVITRLTSGVNVPRAVAIDAYGNIVVGGFNGNSKFVVVRYFPNGAIDTSFGTDGVATIHWNSGGIDTLNALKIQNDGKILVGGDVQVDSFAGMRMIDFGLARLTDEGQLDLTFNKTGKQITYFGQPAASSLWAMTLEDDGKIIAVGDASAARGLAIARYLNDGSLDDDFADGGKLIVGFGNTCHWEAVGLQADHKIVVGGYVWNGKHYDMALVRLLSDANTL